MNGHGAAKHGDAWKTRKDSVDRDAGLRHELKAGDPLVSDYDHDSGELHETHAIWRRLVVLERRLIADEELAVHISDSTGSPGDG